MAPLLNVKSQLLCAHGGRAIAPAGTTRVLVDGAPALTRSGPIRIQGCKGGSKVVAPTGQQHTLPASFCMEGLVVRAAQRVFSKGAPLLLTSSVVIGVPSGKPLTSSQVQARVQGT
jgi:hypothetical protein